MTTQHVDFNIRQGIRVQRAALSLVPDSIRDKLTEAADDGSRNAVASLVIEHQQQVPVQINGQDLGYAVVTGHSVLLLRPDALAQLYLTLERLAEVSPEFGAQFTAACDSLRGTITDESLFAMDATEEVDKIISESQPAQQ